MKRLGWTIAMVAALLLAPLAAQAADGYVTGNVNLRAGPDVDYPRITTIPVGTRIAVQGCIDGWEWCDVIAYGNRGWVAGNFIQYDYRDQRVLLPAYGARIGIPIVSFVIGTYWNDYYRNRPFYHDRDRWYHRPIQHRPPPRPIARPPFNRPPVRPRPPINRPPVRPRPPINRPPVRPRPPIQHDQRPQPRPVQHGRPQGGTRPPAGHAPPGRPAPKRGDDKRDGGHRPLR
jgi:uncharacterized protein YraI